MGSKTSIQWTDASWNPTRGCSRVSPGCENCYAEAIAARFSGPGKPYHSFAIMSDQGPRWTRKVSLVPEHLADPLRWKKPRRIFVNSTSDLFHESLRNEEIAAVLGVAAQAPQHVYQMLTKREQRLRRWFEWVASFEHEHGPPPDHVVTTEAVNRIGDMDQVQRPWPLPNVWIGVSVEDQERFEKRVAELVHVPAAVRFLSVEPLLEGLDFGIDLGATSRRFGAFTCPKCNGWGGMLSSLYPDVGGNEQIVDCKHCRASGCAIDWVIVGGESGPCARPFDLAWASSIVSQCKEAEVACFVKQLGLRPFDSREAGRNDAVHPGGPAADPDCRVMLIDPKGGAMAEWPEELRVRDFPEIGGA